MAARRNTDDSVKLNLQTTFEVNCNGQPPVASAAVVADWDAYFGVTDASDRVLQATGRAKLCVCKEDAEACKYFNGRGEVRRLLVARTLPVAPSKNELRQRNVPPSPFVLKPMGDYERRTERSNAHDPSSGRSNAHSDGHTIICEYAPWGSLSKIFSGENDAVAARCMPMRNPIECLSEQTKLINQQPENRWMFTPSAAAGIMGQVLAGLETIWDVGLAHNDVKASNICLFPPDHPSSGTLDKKLAEKTTRFVDAAGARVALIDLELVGPKGRETPGVGTPGYYPQFHVVDGFTRDMYAFGATWLELLCGRGPLAIVRFARVANRAPHVVRLLRTLFTSHSHPPSSRNGLCDRVREVLDKELAENELFNAAADYHSALCDLGANLRENDITTLMGLLACFETPATVLQQEQEKLAEAVEKNEIPWTADTLDNNAATALERAAVGCILASAGLFSVRPTCGALALTLERFASLAETAQCPPKHRDDARLAQRAMNFVHYFTSAVGNVVRNEGSPLLGRADATNEARAVVGRLLNFAACTDGAPPTTSSEARFRAALTRALINDDDKRRVHPGSWVRAMANAVLAGGVPEGESHGAADTRGASVADNVFAWIQSNFDAYFKNHMATEHDDESVRRFISFDIMGFFFGDDAAQETNEAAQLCIAFADAYNRVANRNHNRPPARRLRVYGAFSMGAFIHEWQERHRGALCVGRSGFVMCVAAMPPVANLSDNMGRVVFRTENITASSGRDVLGHMMAVIGLVRQGNEYTVFLVDSEVQQRDYRMNRVPLPEGTPLPAYPPQDGFVGIPLSEAFGSVPVRLFQWTAPAESRDGCVDDVVPESPMEPFWFARLELETAASAPDAGAAAADP